MREAPRCGAISLQRAHRLSSFVQAWSSIVTFDPVIARQAQELTLMDAGICRGRTHAERGTSAAFRAVRVRAPVNRRGECETFHGPEPYRGLGSSRIVLWQGLSTR